MADDEFVGYGQEEVSTARTIAETPLPPEVAKRVHARVDDLVFQRALHTAGDLPLRTLNYYNRQCVGGFAWLNRLLTRTVTHVYRRKFAPETVKTVPWMMIRGPPQSGKATAAAVVLVAVGNHANCSVISKGVNQTTTLCEKLKRFDLDVRNVFTHFIQQAYFRLCGYC